MQTHVDSSFSYAGSCNYSTKNSYFIASHDISKRDPIVGHSIIYLILESRDLYELDLSEMLP
jgi:hypothetical protein